MAKYTLIDDQPKKGPHRDYEANLTQANLFCQKVQKSLLQGMAAKVVDSEGLKQALLMISFQPPRTSPMGNYAAPIFLHQSRTEVTKQTEAVFNNYMKLAKGFWDSYKAAQQKELIHGNA